jgi:hypothetical protein
MERNGRNTVVEITVDEGCARELTRQFQHPALQIGLKADYGLVVLQPVLILFTLAILASQLGYGMTGLGDAPGLLQVRSDQDVQDFTTHTQPPPDRSPGYV